MAPSATTLLSAVKLAKANNFIGSEWASQAGIDSRLKVGRTRHLLLTFLSVAFLHGCVSWSSGGDGSKDGSESEESEDGEDASAEGRHHGKYPLPKAANAWETRALLMTASQPPAERLTYCQETVDAAAEKATSQEDLMHAIAPMQAAVDRDPEAFHWCFFNLMAHLDTRMENGGSLSEELQPAFFEGMRKLWILSRALDNNLGVRTYFGFLRHRYLHMSHDYFGRSLEIVTRPMDNFPLKPKSKSDSDDSDDDGSKPVKSTVGEKPAGAADVD